MATMRGEGKAANRPIMSNTRGTLAVEWLDGATTFTRDIFGAISRVTVTDEFGRVWKKDINRDTSGHIDAISAWYQ